MSSTAASVNGCSYELRPNELGVKTLSFLFRAEAVEISAAYLNGETRTISCGLRGRWEEDHNGFFLMRTTPDTIADLDRIFCYDPRNVMFSGGWRDQNVFSFSMRSSALLCEYSFQCHFDKDDLRVVLPFNDYVSRTETRDARFVPPQVCLYGKREA